MVRLPCAGFFMGTVIYGNTLRNRRDKRQIYTYITELDTCQSKFKLVTVHL